MCRIKQILTLMNEFFRRIPLKACTDQYNSSIFFETFQSDFIDTYANKKKTVFFFQFFFIFDTPRIAQNLHEHAIEKLNAGMTMNTVAMNFFDVYSCYSTP